MLHGGAEHARETHGLLGQLAEVLVDRFGVERCELAGVLGVDLSALGHLGDGALDHIRRSKGGHPGVTLVVAGGRLDARRFGLLPELQSNLGETGEGPARVLFGGVARAVPEQALG